MPVKNFWSLRRMTKERWNLWEWHKRLFKNKLKPIYEKSMAEESFAKIDEAKRLWNEILDTDIKEGYYYRKARHHIKKYK